MPNNLTEVLANCRDAFNQGEYPRVLYLASGILADAQGENLLVEAELRYLSGNAFEVLRREGAALRQWGAALHLLQRNNLKCHPLALQLEAAIEGHFSSPRVFISYASLQERLARRVDVFLRQGGIETIRYVADFIIGQAINDQIEQAMDSCSAVIVLWSEVYRTRPYCVVELESAAIRIREWALGPLSPVVILALTDMCAPPNSVQGIIHIDLRHGLRRKQKNKLLSGIKRTTATI